MAFVPLLPKFSIHFYFSRNEFSLVAQPVKLLHVEDLDSIPRLGRSPRGGNGYPLQYSCLENSMD